MIYFVSYEGVMWFDGGRGNPSHFEKETILNIPLENVVAGHMHQIVSSVEKYCNEHYKEIYNSRYAGTEKDVRPGKITVTRVLNISRI